jgi:hypothetical protein
MPVNKKPLIQLDLFQANGLVAGKKPRGGNELLKKKLLAEEAQAAAMQDGLAELAEQLSDAVVGASEQQMMLAQAEVAGGAGGAGAGSGATAGAGAGTGAAAGAGTAAGAAGAAGATGAATAGAAVAAAGAMSAVGVLAGLAVVGAAAGGGGGSSDPVVLAAVTRTTPTVAISDDKPGVAAGNILYTFTFSEAVTGFTIDDVTVANGTKGAFAADPAGKIYTLVVTPTASFEGNVTVDVGASAAVSAANGGASAAATQSTQVADTLAPSVVKVAGATGTTVTVEFNGALDAANPPLPGSFTVTQGGVGITVTDAVVNGVNVVLTLQSALAIGVMTNVVYTDDALVNNTNAVQDAAGNDAVGFASGKLADGYVRGAKVYIDTNNNGTADELTDFFVGFTSDTGDFFIPTGAPTGTIIAVGGVNIDTGVANLMPLKAPAGSTSVNPLTTLVESVVAKAVAAGGTADTATIAAASNTVATSLGISLNGGSLTDYDPLVAGDVTAQKAAAQIATVFTLASSGDGNAANGASVLDNLTASIEAAGTSGATLNLADSSTVSSMLAGVELSAEQQSNIADASTKIGEAVTLGDISAAQSQFLDTVAPDAPVATGIAATSDTTPTVRVTFNTQDTTGKAVIAGDTLVLKKDGVDVSTIVALSADDVTAGYKDVTITTVLAEGSNAISATLRDQAGNAANSAATANIVVDTQAPAAPVINAIAGDSVISLAESGATVISGVAEAGSKITLSIGGNGREVTTGGNGVWTYSVVAADITGMGQGDESITATATDAAGNVSTAAVRSLTVDTIAPTLTASITGAGDNVDPNVGNIANGGASNDNTLALSGSVSGALANGDVVVVFDGATRLGTAAVNNTAWTFTTSRLTNAVHSFTARIEDAAGNQGAASSAYGVLVNAAVPAATLTISGDSLTNDTTPTLTGGIAGALADGDVIVVYDGTARLAGTAAVSGSTWTYTSAALTEGVHSLKAVVENAGGNQGLMSSALSLTLDTTPGAAPSINMVAGDDTINAAEQGSVISGFAEAGATVTLGLDSASHTATASSSGMWTYTLTPADITAMSQGAATLTIAATDAAGNPSTGDSRTITVDTVAPNAPTINAVAGNDIINSAEVASTITGQAEAGARISLVLGTGNVRVINADGNGDWSYTLLASDLSVMGQGAETILATAADASGNLSGSTTRPINIDTVAPLLTSFALATDSDTGVKGDGRGNDTTPTIQFTAEAGATLEIDLGDGNGYQASNLAGTGASQSLTTTAYVADATYVVRVKATDQAGNSTIRTGSYILDTVAPAIPSITSVMDDVANLTGAVASGASSNDQILTINGTAENFAQVQVFNGGTMLGTVFANSSGAWTYTIPTALANDSTAVFTARATDAAGNTTAASATHSVIIDTTAPGAPVINAVAGDGRVNLAEKAIGVSVTGTAEAGVNVAVTLGNTTKAAVATDGVWSVNFASGEIPSDGPGSISAVATDGAGNVGAARSLAFTVDTIAPAGPTIAAVETNNVVNMAEKADGVTISGGAESGSTVSVNWGGVIKSAVASVGGTWSAAFAAGEVPQDALSTTLAVSAQDAAGNTSNIALKNVAVDATAPTATLAITGAEDNVGTAQTLASNDTTNDNTPVLLGTLTGSLDMGETIVVYDGQVALGAATLTQTGWQFAVPTAGNGVHVYTARVEDAAGNPGAASTAFNLSVNAMPPASTATITGIQDDSGSVTGAFTTGSSDDTTPTLSGAIVGTPATGDLVRIYDNGNLIGTGEVSGASWSFTPAEPLADGGHSFTALIENSAGSPSAASTAVAYNVDLTPPDAPVINTVTDNVGSITGALVSGSTTNDATLQIEGTAEALSTVRIFNGQTVLGETSASSTGTWSFTTDTLTHQAVYFLSATAVDASGNASAPSAVFMAVIDTLAPAQPIVGNVADDNIVNSEEKAAGVVVTGTAESDSTVVVIWGTATLTTTAVNNAWSVTFAAGQVPADGSAAISVVATDGSGNASVAGVRSVSVDSALPEQPTMASIAGDNVVNAAEKADGVAVMGSAEAGTTVTITWGDAVKTATASEEGMWTVTFAAEEVPVDASETAISATARDAAGNVSVTEIANVAVDTTAPAVSAQADPAGVIVSTDEAGMLSINGIVAVSDYGSWQHDAWRPGHSRDW